jgi:6-phosphogluconate dehydrogenase
MGANMVRRLMRGGHECVVYDLSEDAVDALAAEGAVGATSPEEFVQALGKPRVVWLMVPAAVVDATLETLVPLLAAGDVLVDGGNSYYRDDMDRAERLAADGLHYVDCGTSGGVLGLERGYCLMIGGEPEVVRRLDPLFATLAPGRGSLPATPGIEARPGTADRGYLHCGPNGAGHFVKMVHNGIEYGMMQAYAEGFALMEKKAPLGLDLHQIAEIWRHGSVVRSWLLDLTADALGRNPTLEGIAPYVADSGEGRWTVIEAIDLAVSMPVITLALQQRFRSRDESPFADKLLAAMRNQFGGHAIKPTS